MKTFAVAMVVLTSLFFISCGKSEVSLDIGNGVMLDLVLIRPGKFLMGSEKDDDEKPVHEVTISKPFYLGKYEVTQAQWEAIMDWNTSKSKGPNLPVENVAWELCQIFIEKLNSKGIGTFRLPTEAEWEYACRAGTTEDYSGRLDEMAWYETNSGDAIHLVGTKKPNSWGLYDMHGNVWELCQDRYGNYSKEPQIDPKGAVGGSEVVRRGGCWYVPSIICRSACRGRSALRDMDAGIGFRLVREAQ